MLRVICYRFHEEGGFSVVLTNDITGSNFPRAEKGWRADGQTQVRERDCKRLGAEASEILAAIQQDGYFMGSIRRT